MFDALIGEIRHLESRVPTHRAIMLELRIPQLDGAPEPWLVRYCTRLRESVPLPKAERDPTPFDPPPVAPGPLPRTTCPACGRSVPVRRGGELRQHKASSSADGWCGGTPVPPPVERRTCPDCGRDDVPVTQGGELGPHTTGPGVLGRWCAPARVRLPPSVDDTDTDTDTDTDDPFGELVEDPPKRTAWERGLDALDAADERAMTPVTGPEAEALLEEEDGYYHGPNTTGNRPSDLAPTPHDPFAWVDQAWEEQTARGGPKRYQVWRSSRTGKAFVASFATKPPAVECARTNKPATVWDGLEPVPVLRTNRKSPESGPWAEVLEPKRIARARAELALVAAAADGTDLKTLGVTPTRARQLVHWLGIGAASIRTSARLEKRIVVEVVDLELELERGRLVVRRPTPVVEVLEEKPKRKRRAS